MTVSYSAGLESFRSLLFRWKGSLWRSTGIELLVWLIVYGVISCVYRLALDTPQKRQYETIAAQFEKALGLIPVQFNLGFYVASVMSRYYQQFRLLTMPDKYYEMIGYSVTGENGNSRLIRRTLARYINLANAIGWRFMSTKLIRRFPTDQHLVSQGLMTETELECYKTTKLPERERYIIPLLWSLRILTGCRKADMMDVLPYREAVKEVLKIKESIQKLQNFAWVSLPLVYTQVVTMVTYGYFIICLVSRQFTEIDALAQVKDPVDYYIPIWTILQFLFYVGWLKVGEQMFSPFGDDDVDFEMNHILDRNFKLGFSVVDLARGQRPPTIDPYEGLKSTEILIPRTKASMENPDILCPGSVDGRTVVGRAPVAMELAHSLVLNEQALSQIPEHKRAVFVFEWLRFLDRILPASQKSDIKECQTKVVEQLTAQILSGPGPPIRKLVGRCLATLYSIGDTFNLFPTINTCNDILKSRDDSPSQLMVKLAAVSSIGAMYRKLGRMVGRSFEETIQIISKSLKNAESQGRAEIMGTLEEIVTGLGSAGVSVHKEIFKAAKVGLVDRVMAVRAAAAGCLVALVSEAPFVVTNELESLASTCFKALEGSNHEVRCAVAKLLGELLAAAHNPKPTAPQGRPQSSNPQGQIKSLPLNECFGVLATGFLRGGMGFLKSSSGGTANVAKEIRIGVSFAYVEFVRSLGPVWLERNLGGFIRPVVELAGNFKSGALTPSGPSAAHLECIYARRCIGFILRATLGKMIGEKAQTAACKEIGQLIAEQMNQIDFSMDPALDRSANPELNANTQVLICGLAELACLVQQLKAAATPLFTEASGIMEPVFASLLHPCLVARVYGSWCLRSITVAVPSLITPLIDRCLARLEHLKNSPDAISGYSLALAALLSGSYSCQLGIPHGKGKQVFQLAEELLRTASQSSRLSMNKTQAGWLLLASVMTLGSSIVKSHLPRMLPLWRNAFPRSAKEAEGEKIRGDAFTWHVTLEARAGALAAMISFFDCCKDLATDEVVRRLLPSFDSCLAMLSYGGLIVKQHGQHLKLLMSSVRLRLFQVLSRLNPKSFEVCFASILRELVAELTLTDNPNPVTTSLLRQVCHHDDTIILGAWLQDTDFKAIEDQLQPINVAGSGSLEHDPFSLCSQNISDLDPPMPLPMGVAILDAVVTLYGRMFPKVASKHRLQMVDHFAECVRQAKGPRQQAVQINVTVALLSALKCLSECKGTFETEPVRKSAVNLIMIGLASQSPILRCAAAEALGRTAQVVGDAKFVAEMAQFSFDKLKVCRDIVNRTGYSLALGCLHRYVGGLGSGQHLNTSVSILLALAQDSSSPVVQVWALHALGLIAESGGPMFRGYVDATLGLSLKQLLNSPTTQADLHQAIGKLLSALITTVGPELQSNVGTIVPVRSSFLAACGMMAEHPDALVRAQAVSCLQQLHMFAPRHVNLSILVPQLCEMMFSPHLILRRSATACLRQLAQREAREVHQHAQVLIPKNSGNSSGPMSGVKKLNDGSLPETGIEGGLFNILDVESDPDVIGNTRETLLSLAQCLGAENLSQWLSLCKDILSATSTDLLSPIADEKMVRSSGAAALASATEGDEDDSMHIGGSEPDSQKIPPRFPTRQFAMEVVRKIIGFCENERAHFDPMLAKELIYNSSNADFLVLHLSDLIRMAFMASTAENTELRLAGLAALQDLIVKFCKVPEPEFPGHVILEQYQAQVGAALRPAFAPETPSHVTAAACEVCSTWIGSGVARDLNDLRRVHQLLVSSLAKLKKGSISTQLYSETAATLEKLAILKAWAEVYIVAMRQDVETSEAEESKRTVAQDDGNESYIPVTESLLILVTPELTSLVGHWMGVLKDYALLSLPQEFSNQLPPDGGAFYTPETIDAVRPYYRQSWAPILLAATTWLRCNGFELPRLTGTASDSSEQPDNVKPFNRTLRSIKTDSKEGRFHLILGICMEALCSPRSLEPLETIHLCLETVKTALMDPWSQMQLMADPQIAVEVLNVMHRLILTRESIHTQSLATSVMESVVAAAELSARQVAEWSFTLGGNDSDKPESESTEVKGSQLQKRKVSGQPDTQYAGSEGDESGNLDAGHSVVYATLEVCLCALVRQIPQVNPAVAKSKSGLFAHKKTGRLTPEAHQLIVRIIEVMAKLPGLCSQEGTLAMLPTMMFLIIGIIRECSKAEKNFPPGHSPMGTTFFGNVTPPAATALQTIRSLLAHPITTNCGSEAADSLMKIHPAWIRVMQASMVFLLELSEDDGDVVVDPVVILLGVTLFIVAAPKEVANVTGLQSKSIGFFRKCFASPSLIVQQKTLQTLQSIFGHKDTRAAVPYILALSPLVVTKLRRFFEKSADDAEVESDSIPMELTEDCVPVVMEAVKCMEVLLTAAPTEKRIGLMTHQIYVCLGLHDLYREEKAGRPTPAKLIKDFVLGRLTKIGTTYPGCFKQTLANAPRLRSRLELALKTNSQMEKKAHLATEEAQKREQQSASAMVNQQPSIKLGIDFNAYRKP